MGSRTRSCPRRPARARLDRLIREVDKLAQRRGWGSPPFLVRLVGRKGGDYDVGIRELHDIGPPRQALWAFTAPRQWAGLGIVSEAWAGSLLDERRPSQQPDRRRVRSYAVATRDGGFVSALRFRDEPLQIMEDQPFGVIPESLRRSLGLPSGCTPPPLRPYLVALAVEEVARIGTLDHLESILTEECFGWDRFREMAADGLIDNTPAHWAAWMDAPMFGVWMAGRMPTLPDALDQLKRERPELVADVEVMLEEASIDIGTAA